MGKDRGVSQWSGNSPFKSSRGSRCGGNTQNGITWYDRFHECVPERIGQDHVVERLECHPKGLDFLFCEATGSDQRISKKGGIRDVPWEDDSGGRWWMLGSKCVWKV